MTTGTKSLLFGVHQFLWHPLTVLLAWVYLYRSFPNPKELLCIFVHDWGYWGCPNMDGPEGERHPERAATHAEVETCRRMLERIPPENCEDIDED